MQILHTLYHTDENVLLGAPTGSGKTISAELTILRAFAAHPGQKIIYIAPLKARDSLPQSCIAMVPTPLDNAHFCTGQQSLCSLGAAASL